MIIRMEIAPPCAKRGKPLGLLLAEPPNTTGQHFIGCEASFRWNFKPAQEITSGQTAKFITNIPDEKFLVDFSFNLEQKTVPNSFWTQFDNHFTRAPDDLAGAILQCVAKVKSGEERMRKVAGFVADHFDYGARNLEFEAPKLVCDIATGNCIDINTVFLSSCYTAGIKSTYCAGIFFDQIAQGTIANGMHCWIAAWLNNEVTYWDIAHCLQAGLDPVAPGLNPAGGIRVMMSFGRGLVFSVDELKTQPISHFARPHWVYKDGAVYEADIVSTLHQLDEALLAKYQA